MLARITLLAFIGAVQAIRIKDESNDLPPELTGDDATNDLEYEGGEFA